MLQSEKLFYSMHLLFIGISSEALFNFYSNFNSEHPDLDSKHNSLYKFFFDAGYVQCTSLLSDCSNNMVFLITAGLSFFISCNDLIEFITIKEKFLTLRVLFSDLTKNKEEWNDKNNSLNSINYPRDLTDFNEEQRFAFLWSAVNAIFLDFLKFQSDWTEYDKQLFKEFSDEKKFCFFIVKRSLILTSLVDQAIII
jgi:hypothetical protein